jgi:S-DNA-T family DNA segregation ATPase FtsK/SpoIIIE
MKTIKQRGQLLESTLKNFGVNAKVSQIRIGPAVTQYEVQPAMGVKVSRIVNLSNDIALALAAKDIRIEAPIPGKSAVGIEVPNNSVSMVTLREVLEEEPAAENKLKVVLGRNISGDAITAELNKMPHLLVAGSTGSGKSVCINGIITSILMNAKPHEVKLMMIDPKMVELNVYNGIPHLLTPVVTNPQKAAQALQKIVGEMERRYDLFSHTGTRNIEGYNQYLMRQNNELEEKNAKLPYIVVIVDELADLMMVASKDVESAIMRIAQMARAAGIHLIIATQRPSVDVITGLIKANIPSRIAFAVSSQIDSRTILDSQGAEKLLGRGDMLFLPSGQSKPTRIQGAFLSDKEVESVVNYVTKQQSANYVKELEPDDIVTQETPSEDALYFDALQFVVTNQKASASLLQRQFRIGYNRAARLIDELEMNQVIGPASGSKPRQVLINETEE